MSSVRDKPEQSPASPVPVTNTTGNKFNPVALATGFLRICREEVTILARAFSAWPLAAFLFLAALVLALAYQVPQDWSYKLGLSNPADHLYVQSFNPPENGPGFSFRWSSQESYLRFPGAGRLPSATLTIEMQPGGRSPDLPPPRVQLYAGSRLLSETEVRAGQPVYRFNYRAEDRSLDGDLVFTLKTLNPVVDKGGHNLPLGVVVTQVSLQGGPADGRPVIPALPYYTYLLAGLLLIYLALVRAGWTPLKAALLNAVPALGAAWALAAYRFYLTPAVEDLFLHLALAYPLLVLGLRTSGAWLRLRGQAFPAKDARWLGLIFVAAFVVKAAGLDHPAFHTVDHWFRIHQINRFWDHPVDFWQQYYNVSTGTSVTGQFDGSAVLGQWGVQVALPYSPLFYIFAAPLSLLWPAHNDPNLLSAVNSLASWLETSQLFMLYILLRRAYNGAWSGRAGVIAAAIFGFYPLSFLLFSDGGYNTIFAGWLSLLFITLLVDWLHLLREGRQSRWLPLWMVLSLAAALLAHTSTLLLMGVFVTLACLLLLIPKEGRRAGARLAVIGGAALGLALLLYYGWYIPGLVSQTLPTLLGKLSSGIGQDSKLLSRKLLEGFWPQLWAHFAFWPFLLTVAFFGYWLYQVEIKGRPYFSFPPLNRAKLDADIKADNGGEKAEAAPQTELTGQANALVVDTAQYKTVTLIFVAWLLTFLLFALLDLKVNLLQKHMLFAAPLLCIGSGLALGLPLEIIRVRAKISKTKWALWLFIAVIFGLVLLNFWLGINTWYARVYYWVYQPGSG
ncbi:MAG TPA: hypothetical protein VH186_10850 [Chloroflexia bacterium]|nr:hypothetical protein [Chloroflexia bacterium]